MGESGYVHHGLLYKELEIFVQNGMDEYEALRTATINASEILGIEKEVGTIEIGKKADIVVLGKNPIEDISYLSEIRYVVKEGKILYKAINE
ncbi:MAG TPA: amidohydrolase family protein [Tenericutes bacterium]|nr:amidohydrolase family protein [Mycoplasmatota bacterium]